MSKQWRICHGAVMQPFMLLRSNSGRIFGSLKVLQPSDFSDLASLEQALLAFGRYNEEIAEPFE